MTGRLLSRGLARSDLAAFVMAVLFALALTLPGARSQLLALATLAAVVWIGWGALADGRRGPRSRLVMAFGLLMLAALPALLIAFDHGLWIAPPRLHGLAAGLALWSVGIASIAVGTRAVRMSGRAPAGDRGAAQGLLLIGEPRDQRAVIGVAVIVIVCLAAFVHEVGGPIAYFKDLNNSAAANAGLTYLIWGISFAKYGAFAHLGEEWARGRAPSWRLIAVACFALLLLLFVGSRLLVLIALIQLLLLYAALRPVSRRFRASLAGVAIIGAVIFLGLGEFRRWENVSHHRPSFARYLVHTSLPSLPRTYVNNYADTVRSSVLARQIVPSRAGYEYGKELVRVLLQPLPGSIRPQVAFAPALRATFTSGHGNGNALPLPVEGYIEFGFAGDAAFCLVLGLLVGLVDRYGSGPRDVGLTATAIAAGTGLVIVFRGSLHTGIAIAAIDVIGFFVAHRLLFRRSACV